VGIIKAIKIYALDSSTISRPGKEMRIRMSRFQKGGMKGVAGTENTTIGAKLPQQIPSSNK
jgi:hypothetical protein